MAERPQAGLTDSRSLTAARVSSWPALPPVVMRMTAQARVVIRTLRFKVEYRDKKATIGKGFHE